MARLELATRYRPVHIGLLLVCAAPPASPADDLYAWELQQAGAEAREYLEGLLQVVGVSREKSPAEQLAEFQHLGAYLARLVECPLPQAASLEPLAAQYGPTLVKRITFSYKPRQVALLSPVPPGLPEILRGAGFGDQLAASGRGIDVPAPDDAAAIARVRASLTPVT